MAHERGWVITPERLNLLLVDPTDAYLDLFLAQIDAYLDQLQPRVYDAVTPGPRYRALLTRVRAAASPRPYRVLVALLFLTCVPPARERLHPKDASFLEDFNRAMGLWLLGRTKEDTVYTAASDLSQMHTVVFVVEQLALYRWAFAVERAL
jgi:hypothetical protein